MENVYFSKMRAMMEKLPILLKQRRNQGLANGELPNESGDLLIVMFISKF